MKLFKVAFRTLLKTYIVGLLLGASTAILESCSDNSYINAIPASTTAIVKINPSEFENNEITTCMQSIIPLGNFNKSGIDISRPIFVFETVDGNFGVCAKVADFDNVFQAFSLLADKGKCCKPTKSRGVAIAEIGKSWAVGFSSKSFVILGPFTEASIQSAQRSILRMLHQDEEQSIVACPMFTKLDSINGGVTMIAQLQALPEKLAAPFSIGVPENADNTQVLVSASFSFVKGVLCIDGETFSFDKHIDSEIKKSQTIYRKIGGEYVEQMPNTYSFGMFANVNGKDFLPFLQRNRAFRSILTGINTAIDFDNILRSIDGNIAIMGKTGDISSGINLNVFGKVKNPTWIADVDYWKQSCLSGASITGSGNHWTYRSGNANFRFGIKGDEFYGITDEALFQRGTNVQLSNHKVSQMVVGKRIAMVLNIKPILAEMSIPQGVAEILKPLTDNVNTIVYVVE